MSNEQEFVEITNERGQVRQYETVASRVKRFRAERPDWYIHTKIDEVNDERVLMACEIGWITLDTAGIPRHVCMAKGHAEEYRNASEINATSAVENAETSAIGRALAALGYMSTESFASAQEVQGAIKKREVIDQRRPGALLLLQEAAKNGTAALRKVWDKDLSKADRYACNNDMAALKRKAEEVDHEMQGG